MYSSKAKKLSLYSLLLALILVLGLVEHSLPIYPAIPGIKLGLSNAVLLVCMIIFGVKSAFLLMIAKVTVLSALLGSFIGYGLAGGVFSIVTMTFALKVLKMDIIAVSIIGSCFHIIGQLLVSGIILQSISVVYYFPVLLIASIVTGIITGMISKYSLNALEKSGFLKNGKK